jgi:hypothetical protein
MRPEPKISKHYATPDAVPELFDNKGKRVYLEHRHLAQWFLENDYPLSAATKYIFRAGKKKSSGLSIEEKAIEDLKKAQEYIGFKIEEYQQKLDDKKTSTIYGGGTFPHVGSVPPSNPVTLADVIRKELRYEGLEDSGDPSGRYTNQ